MCSTSKIDDMLKVVGGEQLASAPTVSSAKLKHNRDDFFVVDVREAEEVTEDPLSVTADASIPLGKLLADSMQGELEDWKTIPQKILLVSGTGYRSGIAASALLQSGFANVASLSRGMLAISNPAATVPDLLVVLGTSSSPEKLTLALNASAVAASKNQTVVLVLIGDGVCTFLRKGNNKAVSDTSFRVEETFIGEPFQPTHALLQKFIGSGNSVVLACQSCVKLRDIEFGSDLLDCVNPMQMPDLLRMLEEAKANLQFM